MDHTTASIAAFFADETGTTAVEYGLLAALITVVAITGISLVSDRMAEIYDRWSSAVVAALSGN